MITYGLSGHWGTAGARQQLSCVGGAAAEWQTSFRVKIFVFAGRVSFFTSGSENLHRVEKVQWGTRFAITISFTCDPEHGIGDPVLG